MKEGNLNTYLGLCAEVYDLSKPTPPQDAYQFYKKYLTEANGLVLEPMCGTGRFLLPYSMDGFTVHGFDASSYMLDILHEKAKSKNLQVNVWQDYIDKLNLPQKYQLIFIPSASFGLITDIQKAKEALKIFYDLLADNGVLVFEAETLYSVPTHAGIWQGSAWKKQDGKLILANFLDLPMQDNIGTTFCRYELVDKNTILKAEIEDLKVRLYEPHMLCDMLRDAGFNQINTRKAFDHNSRPGEQEKVVVYECRKFKKSMSKS